MIFFKSKIEKEKTCGATRSSRWPEIREAHLAAHPLCEICGGTKKLNVHHILPFHLHPELELDFKNLITLCEGNKTINCHLRFGHFDSFKDKYNPNIKVEAPVWKQKFLAKDMDEIEKVVNENQ
ncbi:HNH endonuclease [Patescibacteria group bacterium]|nr:HNH endonuclease [Patescibacteria group bacterium]